MSSPDAKAAGQLTLMIYRIAIGPVLLLMVGWIWAQQKSVAQLVEENKALFSTAARLESWARESSNQAAYLEGLKDAIVSGATGPREVKISLDIPQHEVKQQLADIEEQQKEDRSFFEKLVAEAQRRAEEDQADVETEVEARIPPNPVVQPQQVQQHAAPDYDQLPELSERELKRYRATKTREVE